MANTIDSNNFYFIHKYYMSDDMASLPNDTDNPII